MENQTYIPGVTLAGILAVKWLMNRFGIKSRAIRVLVSIVVPASLSATVFAGPKFLRAYSASHDVDAGQKEFDRSVFNAYPTFRAIAQNEPELWAKARKEVVSAFQAHKMTLDPEVSAQIAESFKPLIARLNKVGAAADDDHIIDWLDAERSLIRQEMQESPNLCAGHLLGTSLGDIQPSQRVVRLQQNVQAAVMEAYTSGLKAPVSIPDKEAGVQVLNKAINLRGNELTSTELSIIQEPAKSGPAEICRVWNKLYFNTAHLDRADAANTMRFLLTSS